MNTSSPASPPSYPEIKVNGVAMLVVPEVGYGSHPCKGCAMSGNTPLTLCGLQCQQEGKRSPTQIVIRKDKLDEYVITCVAAKLSA